MKKVTRKRQGKKERCWTIQAPRGFLLLNFVRPTKRYTEQFFQKARRMSPEVMQKLGYRAVKVTLQEGWK